MRSLSKAFLRPDRPLLLITSGLLLYTLYDIYDHISRPDSSFEENPLMWGLFSLASLLTIIVVMFLTARLLERLDNRFEVLYETVGLLVAVGIHIHLSGPVYNRIFWGDEPLNFQFRLVPVLMLCGIYLFMRLVVFNGIRYFIKSRNRTDV